MPEVTVYKLDEHGAEVWQYPGRVLQRTATCMQLEAFFNRDRVDLGVATFVRGDRFVETFYADRWYNVFAVYAADESGLKGWYCNICRPAELGDTAVRCEDLALDLWVDADGKTTTMDEDEFAALDLTAEERRHSLAAAAQVRELAAEGALPR